MRPRQTLIAGDGKTLQQEVQEKYIEQLEKETKALQDRHPFLDYAKTLQMLPDEKLRLEYLQSLKSLLAKDKTLTDREEEYVESRMTWSNLINNIDQINTKYKKQNNIRQQIDDRFISLGYAHNLDKLYTDCIDYLKNNTVIVMTFNASFLAKNKLRTHHLINTFEKENNDPEYLKKRVLTEDGLFQSVGADLKHLLSSNIHARPKYGALILLDRNQGIQAITRYGKSYFVLGEIAKFNCFYLACDSIEAKFGKKQDLMPCTYQHLDILLLQTSDALLKAIIERVTKGTLSLDYNQQYTSDTNTGGYVEVLLPGINFFDSKMVKHIHIDEGEYKLSESDKSVIVNELHISVTNSHTNPYPELCKEFMECIENNRIPKVKELLHSYPSLARITNRLGQEPMHIAAKRGHLDIVKILLPSVIDINRLAVDGKAPLHLAVESGNAELVKLLMGRRDINLNDRAYALNAMTSQSPKSRRASDERQLFFLKKMRAGLYIPFQKLMLRIPEINERLKKGFFWQDVAKNKAKRDALLSLQAMVNDRSKSLQEIYDFMKSKKDDITRSTRTDKVCYADLFRKAIPESQVYFSQIITDLEKNFSELIIKSKEETENHFSPLAMNKIGKNA